MQLTLKKIDCPFLPKCGRFVPTLCYHWQLRDLKSSFDWIITFQFSSSIWSLFVSIKLDPGRQKLRFLLNLQKTLWEWKVTFGQKKHFLKVMICFERPSDSHRVGQIQWKHLTINGKYDRSKTQLNQSHLAEICFILHRMLSLVSF